MPLGPGALGSRASLLGICCKDQGHAHDAMCAAPTRVLMLKHDNDIMAVLRDGVSIMMIIVCGAGR